jgi:hypothetical protein
LKLIIGEKVVESKMSKDAKLQMLQFIQHEAEEYQLMAIVLDGGIVKLDEQAQQIVIDRFNASPICEAMTSREKDFWIGGINRAFGECAKKCGRIAITKEKRLCKQRCKNTKDAKILASRQKMKAAKRSAQTDKLGASVKHKQDMMNKKKLAISKANVAGN